jgi:hypothetical protein
MNLTGFKRLFLCKLRENGRHTTGQHALAAAGAAAHQQIMTAGGCYLHGAAGIRLPLHLIEIHLCR